MKYLESVLEILREAEKARPSGLLLECGNLLDTAWTDKNSALLIELPTLPCSAGGPAAP